MKYGAQLVLRLIEYPAALGRQALARAVHVEGEHRHGRSVGLGFAALAGLGGALERKGDLMRSSPQEYTGLEVERIAGLHHVL